MNWLQALVLGVVQGLTEFLPISSTAHLRIVPHYLGWGDPGIAFSAVIQLGTLFAVFIYFAGDVKMLVVAAFDGLRHRDFKRSPETLLAFSIAVGTLPIAVIGLSFKDFIETEARGLHIIGSALIALAVVLMAAERSGQAPARYAAAELLANSVHRPVPGAGANSRLFALGFNDHGRALCRSQTGRSSALLFSIRPPGYWL